MTPERWQKVDEVLQAALDLPEAQRAALLAEVCAYDPELRDEAQALIEAHTEAGDFLETPAFEEDANILISGNEPNREIGPYKVVERIGQGGMGEVYLAHDTRLGRPVALKTLPPYFLSDDDRLRRFQIEARAASALNHPNILTIYEVGESEGTHYIAAEYIEGRTIRELISAANLTLAEIIDISTQLLSGLSAAHAAGIVHRDIKPENIMRRDDGSIRILDFGIAKLMEGPLSDVTTVTLTSNQTQTGALMGTIGYVSPEQVRALPVDERTDIWSCGVVLHEMLTGRRPFAGVTNADTIVAILQRSPSLVFASDLKSTALRQLQKIVSKALSKEVEVRYQTATEMFEELAAVKRLLANESSRRRSVNVDMPIKALREVAAEEVSSQGLRRFLIPGFVTLALLIGLGLLYRQFARRTPATPAKKTYAQMNEAEQLQFVSEQEQRISAMMGERPVKLSDEALRAIKAHVDYYATPKATPPNLEPLSVRYRRAQPYIPVIARSFEARRIPVVVGIYLAMFESAYKPCPENNWGAKGLFQFLPTTAQHYGVARADMCDVNKMAPAAAHYIADRMAELGDDSQSMTLVLLSYNRGADSVRDALRKLRETDRNYERSFWTLFANRDKLDESFRNESANYVPGFFSVAIIGENPETFELGLPPLSSLAK